MKRSILALAEVLALPGLHAALPTPGAECRNGEFQFSVEFGNRGVDGSPAHPVTAYLWIPPTAQKVRGLIVTQQNVGEQPFVEHPAIRGACARNDLAILWCCAPIDLRFEKNREDAVRLLEDVLRQLGRQSGYPEIGTAPWFTFGHSTTTQFARNLAEARPERTIAILSAKGGIMLPVSGSFPGVYSGGHYPEWRQQSADWTQRGRSLPGLQKIREELRARWRPISYVEEFGGGHFDYTERYLEFLALYIDKAIQHRLNADGSVRLIPDNEGWVVDLRPPLPTVPLKIVPRAEATGELRNAPWFFDRELAEAAVALMDDGKWERENQIVAFANLDGSPATFSKSGIVDPVPYELAADGVTITRIETTFLDQLPGNFAQAGMKLTHATGGPRTIERISGIFAVHEGKYGIRLNRGYPDTPNFIAVRHPGDATHRPSIQPGRFVPPTYTGRAQQITFAQICDQPAGATSLALRASSSAGLKVRFFVRSGSAKVVGDDLVFLPLPPHTRLPIKVTVVAWQLGLGGKDAVMAAPSIEQTFALTKPDGVATEATVAKAIPARQPYDIENVADAERMINEALAPRRPPLDLKTVGGAWKTIAAQSSRPPVKIIFDTDIGTDLDDAIALVFALSRPELDVRAVTTSRGEVQQRAAIVSRLLKVMGRTDIPFAPGSPVMIDGAKLRDKPVNQFPFAGSEADRPKPATDDAQELFRRVIDANPGEVWLVVVGPMTNAAILVRDHLDVAARLQGIVCMGGEPTRAYAETNITNDPSAAAIVCRSGLLKFVGTDDVTIRLLVPKPDMDRLRQLDTPVGRALIELQRLWRVDRGVKPGPVAFDVCPVMWLFAPELFTTKPEGLSVDAAAIMRVAPDAPPSAVTTDMDVVNAHRLLIDTLIHAHPTGQ